MPTYEYTCKMCGHHLEEFQSMSDPELVQCPNCKTDNLVRTIGTGAGLIFKGSGFYLTDYKKSGKGSEGSSETKTESSPKETKK